MKQSPFVLWLRFCILFTESKYKNIQRIEQELHPLQKNISDFSKSLSPKAPYKQFLNDFAKKGKTEKEIIRKIKILISEETI